MKKNKLLVLLPVFMGIMITAVMLVLPAKASQQINSPNHDGEGQHIYGTIDSFPDGLVGEWIVSGTSYTATNDTIFEQEDGPFMVGGCVDVKYMPDTGVAVEIATTDNERCDGEGEEHFYGIIDQVPPTGTITGTWVISGVEFLSTQHTQLNTENGPLDVGSCAKVEYRVINGLNMADEIASQWAYRCMGYHAYNQVFGAVVSYPPDLYGTWVINARNDISFTFMTDPSTHFLGRYWNIGIGTCVRVKYDTQDGVNHAVQVSVNWGHHCEPIDTPSLSKLIATVGARPTDTLTGTWTFAANATAF